MTVKVYSTRSTIATSPRCNHRRMLPASDLQPALPSTTRQSRRTSQPRKTPAPPEPATLRREWRAGWIAAVFLAAALLAFGPALSAPFDFDDGPAIAHNATIRTLWPASIPLTPPGLGTAVSGRPI